MHGGGQIVVKAGLHDYDCVGFIFPQFRIQMLRQAMLRTKILPGGRAIGDLRFEATEQVFGFHRDQQAAAVRGHRRELANCRGQENIAYQIRSSAAFTDRRRGARVRLQNRHVLACGVAPPG